MTPEEAEKITGILNRLKKVDPDSVVLRALKVDGAQVAEIEHKMGCFIAGAVNSGRPTREEAIMGLAMLIGRFAAQGDKPAELEMMANVEIAIAITRELGDLAAKKRTGNPMRINLKNVELETLARALLNPGGAAAVDSETWKAAAWIVEQWNAQRAALVDSDLKVPRAAEPAPSAESNDSE
jgi:hypothetical protein